ncbi:glycosyltransferase WbuB [Pseudomonas aeruginosa]|uniref:Probable glycosyltransferase WbjE n=10 Tax=Pseudomonas aeruginosa TaxID=287 RepID=WBJE_PSEAI|nr:MULTISPECIES: glycosyltransferase family 4 protein [Pseudomonas]Q8KIU8.2 RecName: Full=Probable glycosyltransferase WbjE [Pseudomonas aeruginosa]AAF72957.1 WbjE [Pseudomonas aeruginosa]AAM27680.1 ORF_11; similar to Glycosyltransferases group 1 [Pseudomonas aeruginosa]ASP09378.1 glycosyltransferase WbuB [Pseudomonas aeruginosa]ASP10907.1 glycosyltransferase WbuB [Pseudomonas aeruginosa]AVZ37948.1 glycosyltransferase WbuB [Pseudomonas aeruginosa]
MARIFVVSEYVGANQNSTGYYWEKIIGKMQREFGGLTVIFPLTAGETPPVVSPSVDQECFKFPRSNKNRLLSRGLAQIFQAFLFSVKLTSRARRGDVVLSGTNPALLLMTFPLLRYALGFKWVLLVHDVFPENLVPAGVLKKDSIAYRLLRRLFSFIYSSADRLVVIGRDMEALMKEKVNDPRSLVFISNWACEKEVFPVPREDAPFINIPEWKGKRVFQFFGNVGRLQGIENILSAIQLVKNEKAAFAFIGDGALVDSVKKHALEDQCARLRYFGRLPLAEKNFGLAACDVALVTLEEGMFGLGVPSKAYFSMAADKPILAVMEKGAEISRIIDETGIGWNCPPNDPVALARLIDEICELDLSSLGGVPRSVLQQNYSEYISLEKFAACVRPLLSESKI